MELTNEQIVTKILSEKSILRDREIPYTTNTNYNLGAFLEKEELVPSKYGAKYIFVK